MARVAVPRKMFLELLTNTKYTVFRPGQVSVPIGSEHQLITDMPISENRYNEWTIQFGREGEIVNGNRFALQTVRVTKIVQQELVGFKDSEIFADGHASKLDALEALKAEDPNLSLNSPVTLVYFDVVLP